MKTIKMMMVVPALLAAGCDNGTTTTTPDLAMTAPKADMAITPTVDMAMNPMMPALGAQIERMGRATINVAVTNPFDLPMKLPDGTMGGRDAVRDAYNKDPDPAMWIPHWKNIIRTTLAIYDGADTVCGNQAAADMAKMGPERYDTLATVLADDRIYVDTSKTSCKLYLAVELGALGVNNPECGGRIPTYDVVDFMYTAATVGAGPITMGMFPVTDGIASDPDGKTDITAFPWLDAPNP